MSSLAESDDPCTDEGNEASLRTSIRKDGLWLLDHNLHSELNTVDPTACEQLQGNLHSELNTVDPTACGRPQGSESSESKSCARMSEWCKAVSQGNANYEDRQSSQEKRTECARSSVADEAPCIQQCNRIPRTDAPSDTKSETSSNISLQGTANPIPESPSHSLRGNWVNENMLSFSLPDSWVGENILASSRPGCDDKAFECVQTSGTDDTQRIQERGHIGGTCLAPSEQTSLPRCLQLDAHLSLQRRPFCDPLLSKSSLRPRSLSTKRFHGYDSFQPQRETGTTDSRTIRASQHEMRQGSLSMADFRSIMLRHQESLNSTHPQVQTQSDAIVDDSFTAHINHIHTHDKGMHTPMALFYKQSNICLRCFAPVNSFMYNKTNLLSRRANKHIGRDKINGTHTSHMSYV